MGQCPDKQTLPPPATAPAAQDASRARSALALVAVISMLSGMLAFSALQAASAREQVYLAWAFGVFAIGTFAALIGQVFFLAHTFHGAEARAYGDGYCGAVVLAPGTGCIVVGWVLVGLSLHAHLDAGVQPWPLVAGFVMKESVCMG